MPDYLKLHQATLKADAAAKAARDARDNAIRQAAAEGVSLYRIAKDIGISWQAVKKIVAA
jgi:predicted ATPase